MAVYKRGGVWWFSFMFAGKKVQQSAKTSRKTLAEAAEKRRRLELERAYSGLPTEDRGRRIASIAELIEAYLKAYKVAHRPHSIVCENSAGANVVRHLGAVLLPDLTENRILDYIRARQAEAASGRTINIEVAALARAIGQPWRLLWPKVRKMEERKDVGVALTPEQEMAILEAADHIARGDEPKTVKRGGKTHQQTTGPKSVMMPTLIRLALLTGMRAEELTGLQWLQVDFEQRTITVGRAKTAAGQGRVIPLGAAAWSTLETHAAWWASRFGNIGPDLHVFPYGSPQPNDPSRAVTTVSHGWNAIRKAAGVKCRWHDLRHSYCTKLAEAGVPESTMLALVGHMSRQMLERYSHIRLQAKRDAVEGLTVGMAAHKQDGVPTKSTTVNEKAAPRRPVTH